MAAQGGGGGSGQDDKDSYALLWILLLIFIVGALIWHFWGNHLKLAFIALKKYEVLAISFFIDNENIHRALRGLDMATANNLTLYYANVISTFIGQYLMYPICFVLLLMAIIMFKGSATMSYTKTYNMDLLIKQEKENWPQIAPVAELDLVGEDILSGPWAMSMNPMQFARHHHLLKVEMVLDRKAPWRAEGIPKATLIREKAHQVFCSQMGALWTSVDDLPPHTKALYAIFAARIEHDTEACRAYLMKLAQAAAKGKMDYSDTEALIKKYGHSRAVQLCQQRHAYVSTNMASLLGLARTDGVLASADFLWLKPIDRRLWYILNTVGRQVCVPEVAGVIAHWLTEKEMARPLTVPMVEEAINGLEKAITNTQYVLEEGESVAP